MYLIDTHTHVIPYWDDGAASWDIALKMLKQGQADGIGEVVCTPHILSKNDLQKEDKILSLFEELKVRARKACITTKLHIGSEIYVQPDMSLKEKISTLAQNGRFFLIEFPMNLIPAFVAQSFFRLIIKDSVPIVAHPERYANIINNPNMAYEFVERGALFQINAGSLLGIFGQVVKNISVHLIDANLVHLVASDAHDLSTRPLKLKEAYNFVHQNWGEERAKTLFYENPKRILRGEDIIAGDPLRFSSIGKWRIGKRLNTLIKKVGLS